MDFTSSQTDGLAQGALCQYRRDMFTEIFRSTPAVSRIDVLKNCLGELLNCRSARLFPRIFASAEGARIGTGPATP